MLSTWLSSARAAETACPTCTPAWIPFTWTRFECILIRLNSRSLSLELDAFILIINWSFTFSVKPFLFSRGAHFRGDYCDSLPLRSTPRQKKKNTHDSYEFKERKRSALWFYAVFLNKRDLDNHPFTESRFGSGSKKTDLKNSRRNLSLDSISDLICKYRIFLAIII